MIMNLRYIALLDVHNKSTQNVIWAQEFNDYVKTWKYCANSLVPYRCKWRVHQSLCLSVRPKCFPDFFPQCVQLLRWNFVHGFISMTYRSTSKMVSIDQFLKELCPLNLTILRNFRVFHSFILSAYRYSFDIWYIAWPY
jgi:hypothetical protein